LLAFFLSTQLGALNEWMHKQRASRPTPSEDTSGRPRPQPLTASRRWYDDWPEAGGDICVAVEGSVVSSTVSGPPWFSGPAASFVEEPGDISGTDTGHLGESAGEVDDRGRHHTGHTGIDDDVEVVAEPVHHILGLGERILVAGQQQGR